MGFSQERLKRAAKTLFFVASMLASLLLCAHPLLVIVLDLLVPSALLAVVDGPTFSLPAVATQVRSYRFRASLVDLPLVSALRSSLILCLYLRFSGMKLTYLVVTAAAAAMSAGYVLLKATAMVEAAQSPGQLRLLSIGNSDWAAAEALFLSSLTLAMAHLLAAYRTSCRERRKLLVYRIDIEAVRSN
ncbi:hypothetical protein AXF42_Ash018067 [Apostasia shenzhenica]|uniref:MENTAL domain-containing protein n=1 Tax=Apostasia shenzhenica TaxID=1088818 RepID=A0A2I0AVM9_9ASPA|nr:hypothetical protein AXF42_Ash018067 [Apostasia shenzhenica]